MSIPSRFHKSRAQAASEFLMIYGWAILVVLIVIGAFTAWGILNPGNMLPERCTFEPGIACVDYQIKGGDEETSRVSLMLQNNLGSDLFDVKVSIICPDNTIRTSSTDIFHMAETKTIIFESTNNNSCSYTKGVKTKTEIIFYYRAGNVDGFGHSKVGTMIAKVE